MKKKYEKPMVAVERYQLSQAIAGCTLKIGSTDSQCVIKDTDSTADMKKMAYAKWFMNGCSQLMVAAGSNDGVCYHANVNTAFNS